MFEILAEGSSGLATMSMIAGIGFVGFAGFTLAPIFQNAMNSQLNLGDRSNEKLNVMQPLTEVFYQFDHKGVEDWLNWILVQDKEIINLAFNRLVDYLREPIEELGSVTEDAVKAVVEFKNPESYPVILELIKSSINRRGEFKSIEMFFETSAKSLIKLDDERGFIELRELILALLYKNDLQSDTLIICMIKAIGNISNPKADILDFWIQLLTSQDVKLNIRKEILYQTKRISNDLERDQVYIGALQEFSDSPLQRFDDQNQKILQEIFIDISDQIYTGNEMIWNVFKLCCQKPAPAEVFIPLIADHLKSSNNQLSTNQILDLLTTEGESLNEIKHALAERFKLTETERTLINSKLSQDDTEFDQKVLNYEKSKKTKIVPEEFLEDYKKIEQALLNGEGGNKTRKDSRSIKTIVGDAEDEKIYMIRMLAANLNYSFIYVDLDLAINLNYELLEVKNKINNCRPCLVYLTGIKNFILRTLHANQKTYVKKMLTIINEAAKSPSVKIIANLGMNSKAAIDDDKLKATLDNGYRGKYEFIMRIDKPTEETKIALIEEYISLLNGSRESEKLNIEEFVASMGSCSKLEFIKYITDYISLSLLTEGKLLEPAAYEERKEQNLSNYESFDEDELMA